MGKAGHCSGGVEGEKAEIPKARGSQGAGCENSEPPKIKGVQPGFERCVDPRSNPKRWVLQALARRSTSEIQAGQAGRGSRAGTRARPGGAGRAGPPCRPWLSPSRAPLRLPARTPGDAPTPRTPHSTHSHSAAEPRPARRPPRRRTWRPSPGRGVEEEAAGPVETERNTEEHRRVTAAAAATAPAECAGSPGGTGGHAPWR